MSRKSALSWEVTRAIQLNHPSSSCLPYNNLHTTSHSTKEQSTSGHLWAELFLHQLRERIIAVKEETVIFAFQKNKTKSQPEKLKRRSPLCSLFQKLYIYIALSHNRKNWTMPVWMLWQDNNKIPFHLKTGKAWIKKLISNYMKLKLADLLIHKLCW